MQADGLHPTRGATSASPRSRAGLRGLLEARARER
jgi:hypothetical protein